MKLCMFGLSAVLKMTKCYLLRKIIGKSDSIVQGKFHEKYGVMLVWQRVQNVFLENLLTLLLYTFEMGGL